MLPRPSIIKKLGKDILNGNLEVMAIFFVDLKMVRLLEEKD